MKKIKLFSMLAAALFCGGTLTAQTTIIEYVPGNTNANVGTFTTDLTESTVKINKNTTSVNGYQMANSLKYENDACTNYLTISVDGGFKAGDVLTINHCYNNSAEKTTSVVIHDDARIVLYTTGQSNNTRNVDDPSEDTYTLLSDCASLTLGRSGNTTTYVTGLTVVRPAPKTEPWIAYTPATVDLYQNRSVEKVTETVALKGGNLTDGTYDLTLPIVEGLSITPASVTVAEGNIDAILTLEYSSTTDVEEGNAEVSLTIGELTEKLAITYSAKVTLLEQVSVSEATIWNWAKAGDGVNEILLDATTTPARDEIVILANVDGIVNNEKFNSQALSVTGQYLLRSGSYFQGGYISFNAEKAGKITVDFSNTGSSNATRYLCINDVRTIYSTVPSSTTRAVSDAIEVPAGKVTITFTSDEKESEYCRVYSISYTPQEGGPTTLIGSAAENTPANKVIHDGQLLIIRDGKTYNAQGAVVR